MSRSGLSTSTMAVGAEGVRVEVPTTGVPFDLASLTCGSFPRSFPPFRDFDPAQLDGKYFCKQHEESDA